MYDVRQSRAGYLKGGLWMRDHELPEDLLPGSSVEGC